jgi:hypothetical protein
MEAVVVALEGGLNGRFYCERHPGGDGLPLWLFGGENKVTRDPRVDGVACWLLSENFLGLGFEDTRRSRYHVPAKIFSGESSAF